MPLEDSPTKLPEFDRRIGDEVAIFKPISKPREFATISNQGRAAVPLVRVNKKEVAKVNPALSALATDAKISKIDWRSRGDA